MKALGYVTAEHESLGLGYQRCSIVYSDASKEKLRSVRYMPDGRPVFFSKEARKKIPLETLDYIRNHNWLDFELYAESQRLLAEQYKQFSGLGLIEKLPDKEEDVSKVQGKSPRLRSQSHASSPRKGPRQRSKAKVQDKGPRAVLLPQERPMAKVQG
eukprot:gene3161-13174_t